MSFQDLTFSILEGQSVSEEIDFGSNILVSLMFDGWKASTGIYLETRQHTGASWSILYRPDGQYMLSGVEPSAGMAVGLSSDLMRGKRIIRLRSGVPGALVNQDATRTVTFARQSLLITTRGGGGSVTATQFHGLVGQFSYTLFDLSEDLPDTLDIPSIWVNRFAPIHILEIYAEINAGAAAINLTKNGSNICTADITAQTNPSGADGTNGILDNSGSHFVSGKDAIAVGDKIGYVTTSVGTGQKRLTVVVKYRYD